MSRQRTAFIESFSGFLRCNSEAYFHIFNDDRLHTDVLSAGAQDFIAEHKEHLRAANEQYLLDKLLLAMLEHAPHPDGKRYIAVAVNIAHRKGPEALVDVAKAWMEFLFLPMLTLFTTQTSQPSGNQTPTTNQTAQHMESADHSAQRNLRELVRTTGLSSLLRLFKFHHKLKRRYPKFHHKLEGRYP
ncbi:hypothetical protein VKT23_010498 [Stygiomarasmius scandens]|uniref:Uncharacterized protein n=1 Tax=Marasmiellus scandens TaxID=2682957 RepID=A0ABR1JCT7_9AGAR